MDLLARLAEDPPRAALFLDIDGVLAPIVPRPEDASVPDETRRELRRLNERYGLVACITGRALEDAIRVVGVPELVYVGNHGIELGPDAAIWADRLAAFLDRLEWPRVEEKELGISLHYRGLPDEDAARRELEEIAARAGEAGFVARFGRKVLEIMPPWQTNKGTAVRQLIETHGVRKALYAGDDPTDLDGFRGLDGLELAVRIAVLSHEGPTALYDAADLTVDGPREFQQLLRRL